MTSVYSTCLDTSDNQDKPVMAVVPGHQGIACHFIHFLALSWVRRSISPSPVSQVWS